MDKEELENWKKIKDHLEKEGLENSMYYKRAVAIVGGSKDPLEPLVIPEDDDRM